MFKIQDGRDHFYQWDLNRHLIVEDDSIKQVHFCNRTGECSLVCSVFEEDGVLLAAVPNIILQNDWPINVYGFDKEYTKHSEVFKVKARTRPDDYVYTQEDLEVWSELEQRVINLEENGLPEEVLETQVQELLEELEFIGWHGVGTGAEIFNYRENVASAAYTHAEGYSTQATQSYAHVEGAYTTAEGMYSHAEGHWSVASGKAAHAEGESALASGISSHAEGFECKAYTDGSHAEGYYTRASSKYQHVQGKYNIEDENGKYAHIVGNGDSSKRSNAHTLDWNGNAWFAGEVKVGAGNKQLATKEYVDSVATGGGSVDLSDYYTKAETEALIPDVSGYATTSYVDEAVNNVDIPDVSGFQTAEQVQALINTAIAGITDGEAVSY